jgi:RNA polymerase sigma-70 factor, ECF subfamily
MTEPPAPRDCVRVPVVSSEEPSMADEFAKVFAGHHDFVWRTLGYLGVARPALDDATQDVFIVVHRRLDSYDPATPVRGWLFGIARRIADKYRVRAARGVPLRVVTDREVPRPDQELERLEAGSLVEDFLAGLSADQREVFVLAELEGLTAPEIAAALEVNLNTVYSRLRLARRAFERTLSRHRARWQREGDDVEA